jgi:hypothetical protein
MGFSPEAHWLRTLTLRKAVGVRRCRAAFDQHYPPLADPTPLTRRTAPPSRCKQAALPNRGSREHLTYGRSTAAPQTPSLITKLHQQMLLSSRFRNKQSTEPIIDELYPDDAFARFPVADVNHAPLRSEVVIFVFAPRPSLRERDGDVEIHAHRYVEFRFKRGAAAAQIFAGCDFLEGDAAGVATTNSDWQTHRDAPLGAGACR